MPHPYRIARGGAARLAATRSRSTLTPRSVPVAANPLAIASPKRLKSNNDAAASMSLPQLTHLFATNLAPSPSEEHIARQTISDLTNQVAQLLAQTEAIRRRIDTHKAIIHPMRRLPEEVMAHILRFACSESSGDTPKVLNVSDRVTLDTTQGVWTYSQVCHLWRRILLSPRMTSLWAKIYISTEDRCMVRGRNSSHVDALRTILDRSRKHPLSIIFDAPNPDLSGVIPNGRLLEIIAYQSSRWRDIRIQATDTNLSIIQPRIASSLPHLRTLHLFCSNRASLASRPPLQFNFKDAPQLRDVVLHIYDHSLMVLPWSQLEFFESEFFGDHQFELLRKMTNLVYLRVSATALPQPNSTDLSESYNSAVRRIHLPNLQQLYVGLGGRCLDRFDLPALQVLNCKEWHQDIPALVSRSRCSLSGLSVGDVQARTFPFLVYFLQANPTISVLYIQGGMYLASLVARLTLHGDSAGGTCLLPRLTQLLCSVKYSRSTASDGESLSASAAQVIPDPAATARMLTSRWEIPAALQTTVSRLKVFGMSFDLSGFSPDAGLPAFEKLKKAGMVIRKQMSWR